MRNRIFWCTLFAIAMAFLESIVVIYLRELYFPAGFHFPMPSLPGFIYRVELVREVATLVMLVSVGVLAGRSWKEQFAYFLLMFGVWDIFYYIGLKLFLGWPSSLLTWDILFLIPLVWVGPVLAPLVCAITMVIVGGEILYGQQRGYTVHLGKLSWGLLGVGSLLVLLAFTKDFLIFMNDQQLWSQFLGLSWLQQLPRLKPQNFWWESFWAGETLFMGAIGVIYRQMSITEN